MIYYAQYFFERLMLMHACDVLKRQVAYEIQLVGSYCTFNSFALWKAKAEGKHRFFGWLFLQEKIQTADNLLLKGIECDPVCCLCDQDFETTVHLCLQCYFAQEIWVLVRAWTEMAHQCATTRSSS